MKVIIDSLQVYDRCAKVSRYVALAGCRRRFKSARLIRADRMGDVTGGRSSVSVPVCGGRLGWELSTRGVWVGCTFFLTFLFFRKQFH